MTYLSPSSKFSVQEGITESHEALDYLSEYLSPSSKFPVQEGIIEGHEALDDLSES